MLKNSLNKTNQKVRKLQVEMNYTKSKQQPLPSSPFTLPLLPSMSSPVNDPMTQHCIIGSIGPSTPVTSPSIATLSSQLPIITTNDAFPIPSAGAATVSKGFIPDDIRVIPDVPDCYDQAQGSFGAGAGDHEIFYQSFEKSNELIQGIFQEKDALEKQLQLSRQQRRKNTTTTTT